MSHMFRPCEMKRHRRGRARRWSADGTDEGKGAGAPACSCRRSVLDLRPACLNPHPPTTVSSLATRSCSCAHLPLVTLHHPQQHLSPRRLGLAGGDKRRAQALLVRGVEDLHKKAKEHTGDGRWGAVWARGYAYGFDRQARGRPFPLPSPLPSPLPRCTLPARDEISPALTTPSIDFRAS